MNKPIELLKVLIQTPSFSGREEETATLIYNYIKPHVDKVERLDNNIIVRPKQADPQKKNILLNSHHDTVKVVDGWTYDPFGAEQKEEIIYGLGSTDAGASLVCLIDTFLQFYPLEIPYNLYLVASAEEENFGSQGLSSVLPNLPDIDFGIIGEPTGLTLGVAQKGLIVVDGTLHGKAGHAARDVGINAIYGLQDELAFLNSNPFSKKSAHLGETTAKMTMVTAGQLHNVIPDSCTYVLDVRVNELYTLHEAMDVLKSGLKADLKPRSLRWHSRGIDPSHPIFLTAKNLNIKTMGSPTLSDQVHCDFPTVKIGPGQSERSHTADEFIHTHEIKNALKIYKEIIENIVI